MTTSLLLSGGMDSICIAFWHRPDIAVTIDYGQRPAEAEIQASAAIADALNIQHEILRCDLSQLGSGDMAGKPTLGIGKVPEWWPYRNQMLITLAAMKCISLGTDKLMIGTLATDGAHADGTNKFVDTMSAVLQLQEGGIKLVAPAIQMTALELVRASKIPQELLAWAHSCHVSNFACGTCRGCLKHFDTIRSLGFEPY